MDLGPHAAFIWISYVAVAVVVAGLIGWLFLDGKKQTAALEALGKRGIRRRSSAGAE
jgi:heme exporter protein D